MSVNEKDTPSAVTPRSFGRADLRELLEDREGPAISIFLPADGSVPDADRDRLRLRAALDRASELLAETPTGEAGALLSPLRSLSDVSGLWQRGESLAIFRAPGFLRVFHVFADVADRVVVAPTFHTRPLLRSLQSPGHFWVLEVAQGSAQLWSGDARAVHPVDPSPVPADMESALGYEYSRDSEMVRRSAGGGGSQASRRAQRGGSAGAFSAHGVGDNDRDPAMRAFFRAVDSAVADYVGAEGDPVILAAVGEHHPRYRAVTTLANLTPRGIEASVHSWTAERLHETAWPIAVEVTESRVAAALDLWERAFSGGKAEMDLAAVARLAVAGRIRALLIERDRRLWGTIDRATGEIQVTQVGGEDPGAEAAELLDEISEVVVLLGGSTLVVSPDQMPTDTGIAGILR